MHELSLLEWVNLPPAGVEPSIYGVKVRRPTFRLWWLLFFLKLNFYFNHLLKQLYHHKYEVLYRTLDQHHPLEHLLNNIP